MLEAKNIHYTYPSSSEPVLKDISISIQPGQVVGLYGPSGKGKTTLARILAGYIVPNRGQILVNGESMPEKGYNPVQLLQQHSELAVNPRWKVKDILSESSPPNNKLTTALHIKESWLQRYPHELSGGEIQRICVARALGSETRYFIADETTSMLDAIAQVQIWKVLLAAVEKNKLGILAISHDHALLKQVCGTIYFFSENDGLCPEKIA